MIYRKISLLVLMIVLVFIGNSVSQTIDEAMTCIRKGNLLDGRRILEQVLQRNDRQAEAHYQLGRLHLYYQFNGRDVDKAVDYLERAVELDPSQPNYFFDLGNAYGESAMAAGMLRRAIIAPKAKKAFLQTLALDRRHVPARIGLVRYLLSAPSLMGGDDERGWKEIDTVIMLNPLQGRMLKASMLNRVKKTDEAESEWKGMLSSYPKEWRVWKGAGYFYLGISRFDDGIGCFERYVSLRPDTADSFESLGEALLKKGQVDEAISAFNKALKIDGEYIPAVYFLGEALLAKGKKAEARARFQDVMAKSQSEYYRNRASEKLKE